MKKMNAEIKFKLNNKFYQKKAIQETIEAFQDVCSAKFNQETFEICLKPKQECDINKLGYEFCNYCLGLMQQ